LADDEEQAGIVAAEKADKLVTRLRETDFRARRVFELTRNPLLLTNLCLVHRHRGDLPQKRARLYLECIDVLLEHWRGAKEIRFGVDAESGRRILQPAALWLHGEEGRTRAGAGELAPVIEPALAGIKWKGGSARDFLNQVRDVSGLLTGWDLENYGFMHLGFQEFLAAAEIRRQSFDDPLVLKELASHFGESWWQEVGLLLLALQDPSVFLPYMREVVKVPAFAKNADLVEACLDDAAEVSKEPFLELVRLAPGRKKELWPRQLQAARILGQIDPKEVHALAGQLKGHPSEEIRRWIADLLRRRADDVTVADRVEYELVRIPAGRFKMGSPKRENRSFDDERPVHEVDVPAFEIGRFPVTNEQYGRFMEESPDVNAPEYWGNREFNGRRQPVVGVSWDEANRFAEWAGLRLPTEAEWEYACRAGTRTRFYTGDKDSALDRAGWFDQNSGGATHPVGEKEPNDFGLYDMHGNVWEWTDDDWHGNYEGAPKDGRACTDSPRGRYRVIRGGGWVNGAEDCRSAIRSCDAPGYRNDFLGFRLSRSLP
jgi:formylglycine-generating enzyme required for sulfatase activity